MTTRITDKNLFDILDMVQHQMIFFKIEHELILHKDGLGWSLCEKCGDGIRNLSPKMTKKEMYNTLLTLRETIS